MKSARRRAALIALATAVFATASLAEAGQPGLRLEESLRQRLREKKAEEERPIDLQAILPGARKRTESYGPDAAQQVDVYTPPNARR